MATWEDDEADDSNMASKRKRRDSSEEDSGNETDGGYGTDRCGRRGRGIWRDLKIKQQGGRTGRKLLDEMSNDGVREDNDIDREREETCRKSTKNKKTDERKSESEAKSRRTSPRKGHTENTLSPVRISGLATK